MTILIFDDADQHKNQLDAYAVPQVGTQQNVITDGLVRYIVYTGADAANQTLIAVP